MADPKRHWGPTSARRIGTIYDRLGAVIEPKSDLDFDDPFELLVAVVLSAQATDRSVNEATTKLYAVANTPETILALGEDGLKPYIRTIGLYNAKAKNVIALCRQLIAKHGGAVPDTREALQALPGVGRKTANVVLNIAFGQPTIAVDTHVHRVANRLGIAVTTNPDHTEAVLVARTPKRHALHAHHYLILHGRYCCLARKPKCGSCPIADLCPFPDKDTGHS
ncbi:MAG: endonuclease III [Planctomycetota bacterium]|jgi:endonuclease-3|nr:endonuclease III [Planctomycetota bacterium]